jgi:hypothetical protein
MVGCKSYHSLSLRVATYAKKKKKNLHFPQDADLKLE